MLQDSNWDEEIILFFKRIVKSFAAGLLWLLTFGLLGYYVGFAVIEKYGVFVNILFYLITMVALFFLVKYLLKLWKV